MPKKTTKEPDLMFMTGSEGNADYLLVAKNGSVVLGVKPLSAPLGKKGKIAGTFVGIRIRAAQDQNNVAHAEANTKGNVTKLPVPIKMDEAFPGIKFGKVSKERASCEMGVLLNRTIYQWDELQDLIEKTRVWDKLFGFVEQGIKPEDMMVAKGQFKSYISGKVQAELTAAAEAVKPPVNDEEIVADATVISMKEAKYKMAGKPMPDEKAEKMVIGGPSIMHTEDEDEDEDEDCE